MKVPTQMTTQVVMQIRKARLIPLMVVLATSVVFLSSCDSDDDDKSSSMNSGVFVDSAVSGVTYETETLSGVTGLDGEYSYLAGETVTFSIGNITFPTVPAKGVLTPIDIAIAAGVSGANVNDSMVINIARLLQSLDSDNDPSNGIIIDEPITTTAIDFSQSVADFAADVVATMPSITLISEQDATEHLQAELDALIAGDDGDNPSLPEALSGQSFDLTFASEQSGAPYSNDDEVKFTLSSSGAMFIDINPAANDGDEITISSFSLLGSEFIWEDNTNGFSYAVSLNGDALNEINVLGSSANMPFLGQFTEAASGEGASAFNISGSISGADGTGQWLLNINGEFDNSGSLTNGSTAFSQTTKNNGSDYEVLIFDSPKNLTCTVANGSGTLADAEVTNIDITCIDDTDT